MILFFSVFTTIFLVMTVIILQVMNTGIYASVDRSLMSAKDNIAQYVNLQMDFSARSINSFELDEEDDDDAGAVRRLFKPDPHLVATADVILYRATGAVLNQKVAYGQLYDLELDRSAIDNGIIQKPIENYWGKQELYRTLTVSVSNLNYPEVSYATILINTDQLEASHDRSVQIIVSMMVVFWVISLFASLYLAKRTRQPILESFERQKSFVENASHELRTPLAVLQNRLESLFRHPDETILDHSESIAASLDEVRNMKLLTTNLLNLARRDDGLVPELTAIEPAYFDDLFANYDLIAQEQGKVLTGLNQLVNTVESDKTLLKQLLTILFDNAVKYTGEDGQISLRVSHYDKQLCIEVADNGPGIPDSEKRKIFDRFYRIDKARTRQLGGFGLGLSLAQQIVRSLGGDITVLDQLPKGTLFRVRLKQ